MGKRQIGKASKYQAEAEKLLDELQASAVILIVKDGLRGNGMAFSVVPGRAPELIEPRQHAAYLRAIADTMDGGIGPAGVGYTTKGD